MSTEDLPTLKIRLSPADGGRYTVELQLGEREFPASTIGPELLSSERTPGTDGGARLFDALVSGAHLRSAWDQASALHPRRRIRLRIDDRAPELHALPWETLHDTSPTAAVRRLAADLDTPFSRDVACPWAPLGPCPPPIEVLTAVAAPTDLDGYALAPIDRAHEEAVLAASMAAAPPGLVRHTALAGPCTLTALAAALERGYHVLHLVAHGVVTADRRRGALFLERADGAVERVDVARFAQMIDGLGRSLRLVVLMSCDTAARDPADARFGFAPALLAAGVPAVLAMQDSMPMDTGAAFTRAFYEELWRSGQIDLAANRARRVVVTERLPGTAVPALYVAPRGLFLWTGEPARRQPAPAPAAPAPTPAWEPFGGPFVDLQLVLGPGGRAHAFGLADDGALRQRHELAPDGPWSAWEPITDDASSFAAVANTSGRMTLFVTRRSRAIETSAADAAGRWGAWSSLAGVADRLAPVVRRDGALTLVARNGRRLYVREQRGSGGPWDPWYPIGGQCDDIRAVRNGADHIILLGAPEDELWMSTQFTPHQPWDDWFQLGRDVQRFAAAADPRGCVHLYTVDPGGVVSHCVETRPGCEWTPWRAIGARCRDILPLDRGNRGLELVWLDDRGAAWHQRTHAGAFGPVRPLGGEHGVSVRAIETATHATAVFVLDGRGEVRLRVIPP